MIEQLEEAGIYLFLYRRSKIDLALTKTGLNIDRITSVENNKHAIIITYANGPDKYLTYWPRHIFEELSFKMFFFSTLTFGVKENVKQFT